MAWPTTYNVDVDVDGNDKEESVANYTVRLHIKSTDFQVHEIKGQTKFLRKQIKLQGAN